MFFVYTTRWIQNILICKCQWPAYAPESAIRKEIKSDLLFSENSWPLAMERPFPSSIETFVDIYCRKSFPNILNFIQKITILTNGGELWIRFRNKIYKLLFVLSLPVKVFCFFKLTYQGYSLIFLSSSTTFHEYYPLPTPLTASATQLRLTDPEPTSRASFAKFVVFILLQLWSNLILYSGVLALFQPYFLFFFVNFLWFSARTTQTIIIVWIIIQIALSKEYFF